MKKIYNKCVSFLLCVGLLLGVNYTYVNADDNNDVTRATNVLLQSGWTQEEINDFLTKEALLEYKNAQPAVISEKKYFKVSESLVQEVTMEECDEALAEISAAKKSDEIGLNSIIPGGQSDSSNVTTTDGYMEYYVSAYNVGNGEYILSARYEWLTSPFFTDEDVFGLGHDDNLTQLSDYDVYYVYKVDGQSTMGFTVTDFTDEYTVPDGICIDKGGTVVKQNLATNVTATDGGKILYSNHRGFIQYHVKVNNSNVNTVAVYAEYLHQQHVFSVSPSISYPASGSIGVTSESNFKRMSPNPYLSFEVCA